MARKPSTRTKTAGGLLHRKPENRGSGQMKSHVSGMSQEAFLRDTKCQDSVIRRIEIKIVDNQGIESLRIVRVP